MFSIWSGKPLFAAACLSLCLSACDGSGEMGSLSSDGEQTVDEGIDPLLSPVEQFQAAKAKWQAAEVTGYGFTLERRGWNARNGDYYVKKSPLAVYSVGFRRFLGDLDRFSAEEISEAESASIILTIDGLFDEIENALDDGFAVHAQYDVFRGYPYHIEILKPDDIAGSERQGIHRVNNFYEFYDPEYFRDNDAKKARYYEVIAKEFAYYTALWEKKKPETFTYTSRQGGRDRCRVSYDGDYSVKTLPKVYCNPRDTHAIEGIDGKLNRTKRFIEYTGFSPFEIAFDRKYGYPSYVNYERNIYEVTDFETNENALGPYYQASLKWSRNAIKARNFTVNRQGTEQWPGQFKVTTNIKGDYIFPSNLRFLDPVIESVWSEEMSRYLTADELAASDFSIAGLFRDIKSAASNRYTTDAEDHDPIDAEYHEDLGYPLRAHIKRDEQDGGDVIFTVTDFSSRSLEVTSMPVRPADVKAGYLESRARWEAQKNNAKAASGNLSYRFYLNELEVTVRDSVVQSVWSVTLGGKLTSDDLIGKSFTIDSVFDDINTALENDSYVSVLYHQVTGLPQEINLFDRNTNAETKIAVWDFMFLPAEQ